MHRLVYVIFREGLYFTPVALGPLPWQKTFRSMAWCRKLSVRLKQQKWSLNKTTNMLDTLRPSILLTYTNKSLKTEQMDPNMFDRYFGSSYHVHGVTGKDRFTWKSSYYSVAQSVTGTAM